MKIRTSSGANEWRRGEFVVSTDPEKIDLARTHAFLSKESYWAAGISLQTVRRSIENSLVFGLYLREEQIGFARVITDLATFGYLADVFVIEPFRRQGFSKWLLEIILNHPDLRGFRRWMLATRDAHELYRGFGFAELENPSRWMERHDRDIYRRES